MSGIKEAINKGYISQIDPRILKELFSFIYDANMKEVAQQGHHDDGVMSESIGIQMRKFPLIEF